MFEPKVFVRWWVSVVMGFDRIRNDSRRWVSFGIWHPALSPWILLSECCIYKTKH